MQRADGNRIMWLLKSTSDHHRPERLAAAVALGILAGLVPKLNLLAIGLYALILFLPIHTLLAISVSVIVSLISFKLDATSGAIGQSLLRHEALRSTWLMLEQAPLVPWLSLHNTVVLGNLVIGTVLLAPSYLISLRVFERMAIGSAKTSPSQSVQGYAPVSTEEAEPFTTRDPNPQSDRRQGHRQGSLTAPGESTVERSPAIIPPPKLHRAANEPATAARVSGPDEPVLFEPLPDSSAEPSSLRGWHMQRSPGTESVTATSSNKTQSQTAQARSQAVERSPATPVSSLDSDIFYPQMMGAVGSSNKELPPAPQRPEGKLDSMQVAQSAGEFLAWVDDLLDECMAEEGMTVFADGRGDVSYGSTTRDDDVTAVSESGQPRWLLETTIEIVRLTDETMSEQLLAAEQSIDCQNQTDLSDTNAMENSVVMPAESSLARAWPAVGSVTTASGMMPTAIPLGMPESDRGDQGEPTILNLNQASHRSHSDKRGNAGFQQLVMAGVNRPAGDKPLDASSTESIEPVKGECLAYLLGHLRQSREGKST